jgi:metal-dependent amidase/aminoacylase/carboxypeptidase family protein
MLSWCQARLANKKAGSSHGKIRIVTEGEGMAARRHAYAELSNRETQTAKLVAEQLSLESKQRR